MEKEYLFPFEKLEVWQLAHSSLMEVICQLNIAKELGFIRKRSIESCARALWFYQTK